MARKWIETSGGALILIESDYVDKWGGAEFSSSPGVSSDYERTFPIFDYLGVISLNSIEAIVFGDEPDRTSCIQLSKEDALFLRWKWAESEDAIDDIIQNITNLPFDDSPILNYGLHSGNMTLFDSSFSGDSIKDKIEISLNPGNYIIKTEIYEPNRETCFVLHRMKMNW